MRLFLDDSLPFTSQANCGWDNKDELLIWPPNPINKSHELLYPSRCFCRLPPTERLKIVRSSYRAPFLEQSHCLVVTLFVAPSQPLNSAVSPRWRCTEQTGQEGAAPFHNFGTPDYWLRKKLVLYHHASSVIVVSDQSSFWVVVNAKTKREISDCHPCTCSPNHATSTPCGSAAALQTTTMQVSWLVVHCKLS